MDFCHLGKCIICHSPLFQWPSRYTKPMWQWHSPPYSQRYAVIPVIVCDTFLSYVFEIRVLECLPAFFSLAPGANAPVEFTDPLTPRNCRSCVLLGVLEICLLSLILPWKKSSFEIPDLMGNFCKPDTVSEFLGGWSAVYASGDRKRWF